MSRSNLMRMASSSSEVGRFRNGLQARPNDMFIAVMGVTGAGKSSFISLCSGQQVEIGHDLQACTSAVEVYACKYSPTKTIYLIDTPGFDDTNRSDTEVLREIAMWLTESYSHKIYLNGIIYLHRISDIRMHGSAKKNLLMFKKLCGQNALKNVILATTMWDRVSPEEGASREAQLKDTPEFWGWMLSNGSRIFRHTPDRSSAMALLSQFVQVESRVTLDLQSQMVDEHKTLDQTGAGKELESEIQKERAKFAQELKEIQEQMQEAVLARDKESERAMQELQRDYSRRMQELEHDRSELKISMERLHEERYAKLERMLKEQQEAHARELEEIRQVQGKGGAGIDQQVSTDRRGDADAGFGGYVDDDSSSLDSSHSFLDSPAPGLLDFNSLALEPSDHGSLNPGKFMDFRDVSVGISGDDCCLIGPKHVQWKLTDSKKLKKLPKVTMNLVAMGQSKSWVVMYTKAGNRKAWVSSQNMADQYPGLLMKMKDPSYAGDLEWVTLGPNGTYVAKFSENAKFLKIPEQIKSALKGVSLRDVETLALGNNETWVLGCKDGRSNWNLKGQYGSLEASLKKHSGSGIKAVTLDTEDTRRYVVFFGNGKMRYHFKRKDFSDFETWERQFKPKPAVGSRAGCVVS